MRTTITVDDSLVEEVRKRAVDTGQPFKSMLNETLRRGLARRDEAADGSFALRTFSMGYPPRVPLETAIRAADSMETGELVRKQRSRK